jgi:ABC-type uncharacterized transport system involved in gliding motility auxiliary subunit
MRVSKWFSGAGLLILALAVLFSTLFIDWAFKGLRFDLTQGGVYTLSDGSKNIVRDIPETVDLTLYFSQTVAKDAPGWSQYAKQVRELLEEFVLNANGKIKLHVVDPEPFSENEDRAAAAGLQAVNAGNDKLFFGLVAQVFPPKVEGESSTAEPRTEVIEIFNPERQEMLEYDIAKLIYQVSQKGKPRIALLTSLEVSGGFDFMTRQPSMPWAIMGQLQQLFEVVNLTGNEQEISADEYPLLLVIHPKNVSDAMQFAIDQYVLNGGHALIFVDPFAEQDKAMSMEPSERSSDLAKLFKAWGVEYDKSKFIGDAQLALQVGMGQGMPPVRHLGILQLSDQNIKRDDVMVGKLETVHYSTTGFLMPVKDAKTTFEPVMQTSEYAMPIDISKLTMLQDPRTLMQGFAPTGEKYALAARVSGDVSTAFPEGAPKKEAEAKDESGDAAEKQAEPKQEDTKEASADGAPAEFLKTSRKPINVLIVADTDMLSDRLWVQMHQFFGQQVMQPFADNGDFLFNAVDILSGSADLSTIRGRGRFFRPFTVVKEMQREAEAEFQQVEESLNARLQDIEGKLAQLQQQQGEDGNVVTLTPEMQADLLKFQQEKLSIRKQLREVQHQLNKDIDQLDFKLKLINIAGVPLLLTLLVIGIALVRRKRALAC